MLPSARLTAALVATFTPALAGVISFRPEGRWETLDDRTGARRAWVQISIRDGRLAGVIERLFLQPGERHDPACTRCRGTLHNRPVLGMQILGGHTRSGDRWVGGWVVDPENGREYRSSVWLEGRDRLRVRGYWGPFHRTQTWQRRLDDGSAEERRQ